MCFTLTGARKALLRPTTEVRRRNALMTAEAYINEYITLGVRAP
jgi:hypothetical protein